jgi:long-chain acyl-CoA synthetase
MTDLSNKAILNGDNLKAVYPDGVNWDTEIRKVTLNQLFNESVSKHADLPCIDFFGKKLTYNELDALTDKAARGFQDMGVKKGTKVGLYMPNTHWYPVMFFGALKAGAVVVNYSTVYVESELEQQIKDSGTTILVTSDKPDNFKNAKSLLKKNNLDQILAFHLADATSEGRSLLPAKMKFGLPVIKALNKFKNFFNLSARNQVSYVEGFINNDGQYEQVHVDPEDTAVLQYTSGSSGVPKGCELTHYNVSSNAQQVAHFIADNPDTPDNPFTMKAGKSKMFAPLPDFHIFGMTATMVAPIILGLETVMVMDPRDLETSQKVIDSTKPDSAALVPRHVFWCSQGRSCRGQLQYRLR